jgi:hypothetical protein
MSPLMKQFYPGDMVRVNTGRPRGLIGKALRVVEHAGLPTTVLVKFMDGQLYYCLLKSLSHFCIGDRSMESVRKVINYPRSNEGPESNAVDVLSHDFRAYQDGINRRMLPHLNLAGASYRIDETYVKVRRSAQCKSGSMSC